MYLVEVQAKVSTLVCLLIEDLVLDTFWELESMGPSHSKCVIFYLHNQKNGNIRLKEFYSVMTHTLKHNLRRNINTLPKYSPVLLAPGEQNIKYSKYDICGLKILVGSNECINISTRFPLGFSTRLIREQFDFSPTTTLGTTNSRVLTIMFSCEYQTWMCYSALL